jgi:hypothetical protein
MFPQIQLILAARLVCHELDRSFYRPIVRKKKQRNLSNLERKGPRVPDQSETICVVDDDASVLKALHRLLRSAGLEMMPFHDPILS